MKGMSKMQNEHINENPLLLTETFISSGMYSPVRVQKNVCMYVCIVCMYVCRCTTGYCHGNSRLHKEEFK